MDDAESEKWGSYILSLLKEGDVLPPARILETACGTGRITVPLAEAGYDVVAMDLSEEMLLKAQEKLCNAGLCAHFVSGDMTDFVLPSLAGAVVCACDGVNYLTRDEQLIRFFTMCRQNLMKNGMLAFDISSYNKLTKKLGNNFFYDDRDDITCFWQNRLKGDLLTMELALFIKKDAENLYKRLDEEHVQKAYRISKIKKMLKDSGFRQVRCFNFLTEDEASEENERIQFTAVKG
jgi:ubiquinone/menaquinone biosynthesis C-methylase UbiE